MASVKMSQKLEDAIMYRLNGSLNKRYEMLLKGGMKGAIEKAGVLPSLLSMTENTEWGEFKHLRNSVPDDWCFKFSTLAVKVFNSDKAFSKLVSIDLDSPFVAPPAHKKYKYWSSVEVRVDLLNADTSNDVLVACSEYMNRELECNEFNNKAMTDMKALLRSVTTLNEALKKYPELKMFVPSEYMTKVETKVVKTPVALRAVETPTSAIDFDTLTSVAVLSSIAK